MQRKPPNVPVSRNPEVVRNRILAAAQAEFMAHGYEAASTNRITERFGGSKATLFRHYASKEAMLEAVVRRIAGQWRQALDWRGLAATEPAAWLEAMGVRALGWILGDEPIFVGRLAIAEGHKFPALERTFEETAARPIRDLIARQLRRWTKQRALACTDPTGDADRFMDLVVAGLVSRRLYGERVPGPGRVRANVRRSVELFLHGCTRARRRPSPGREPRPARGAAASSSGGARALRPHRP